MIGDLKPYGVTKDSGVSWLGQIPEHWEVRRLGSLGRFSASGIDKNTVPGEPLVSMVNYMDVYDNPIRELDGSRTYQRVSCPEWKKKVHDLVRGDVLFTPSSETPEEIGLSAVCVEDLVDTVYSYHVIRFRPATGMAPQYKKYWCNSRPVLEQFSARCKGTTRQILTRGDFRSIWTVVPTLGEQKAIARLLDHADRGIRRYIRAKERLIELLEEQKQAIIHQAVTGQIDVRTGQPYPAYKDSGVEWLGEVPEHWGVRRVKGATRILRGKFTHRPRNDPSLYGGPFPFVQTGDVARANKKIESYSQTLNEKGLAVSRKFPSGTLVMAIAANIGDVAVLDFEACFPDSVVGFVPIEEITRRDYLYYVFLAMKRELIREAPVNTQGNLNVERLGSRRIPLPPSSEQFLIDRYIGEATVTLNSVVEQIRRQIELLKEYRTRLIADVVTGKLDVREAAAALPEIDPLDEDDSRRESEANTSVSPHAAGAALSSAHP